MIAALYVETGGCYFGLPDVDPWDEKRDARLSSKQRLATPPEFRDVLLSIARSVAT